MNAELGIHVLDLGILQIQCDPRPPPPPPSQTFVGFPHAYMQHYSTPGNPQ